MARKDESQLRGSSWAPRLIANSLARPPARSPGAHIGAWRCNARCFALPTSADTCAARKRTPVSPSRTNGNRGLQPEVAPPSSGGEFGAGQIGRKGKQIY